MANKLDAVHPVALHAEEDAKGRVRVTLSEPIVRKQRLMRWLHHRVIDLLADNQLLDCFADDLERRIALLSADITSDFVAALLEEGEEAVKHLADEPEESDQQEDGADDAREPSHSLRSGTTASSEEPSAATNRKPSRDLSLS